MSESLEKAAMRLIWDIFDRVRHGGVKQENIAQTGLQLALGVAQAWHDHEAGVISPEVFRRQLERTRNLLAKGIAANTEAAAARLAEREKDAKR